MPGILALEEPLGGLDSSTPGDFRHYIFGLLFYKSLRDVWEEKQLAQYKDDALAREPEEHRFDVPEGRS